MAAEECHLGPEPKMARTRYVAELMERLETAMDKAYREELCEVVLPELRSTLAIRVSHLRSSLDRFEKNVGLRIHA